MLLLSVVRNWVPDPSVKTAVVRPMKRQRHRMTSRCRHINASTASFHHHKNVGSILELGTYNKQQQHEARVSIHTAIYIFQTATINQCNYDPTEHHQEDPSIR